MTDSLLLYNIARMYYLEQFGQQQIADITGVSRPQVSRMLKEARQCGLVDITVHPPYSISNETLVRKLKECLNLNAVHVVDVNTCRTEERKERRAIITAFAADYLCRQFKGHHRIGIGWGASLYNTVLAMPFNANRHDICFVPLVGNACIADPCYQTNSIVDRIAEKFKASKIFLNAPAFVGDEKISNYLFEMNGLHKSDSMWNGLECDLFSLGASAGYDRIITDYLYSAGLLDDRMEDIGVADILGIFLDQKGETVVTSKQIQHLAISLEKLKQIPRRICLAYYEEKAEGILLASRMGLISELITDSYTALEIIRKN